MNGFVEINGLGGISAQKKYRLWVKQTGWVELLLEKTKWRGWNDVVGGFLVKINKGVKGVFSSNF